jgi:hypothetical protein
MPPPPHDRLARTAAHVPVLLGGSRSPTKPCHDTLVPLSSISTS